MPRANTVTAQATGNTEQAAIMLLSDAVKAFSAKTLAESIVVIIPDTGKAKFSPSHEILTGKQAGKMSKATFVVAELGSSFAGVPVPFAQGNGDVADLPLSIRMSIVASPPNRDGLTVAQALNRKAS